MKQQRLKKRNIITSKMKRERCVIQFLRENGVEGGRKWYKFMRGERMSDGESVESLKVNDEFVTYKGKKLCRLKSCGEISDA